MCANSHCADALSITMSIFSSGANTNKDLKKTQMLLIKNNFHSMEYMSAFLGITHCVGTPAPTAPGWFSAFADGVRTRTTAEGA